jgi:hypothetical protein
MQLFEEPVSSEAKQSVKKESIQAELEKEAAAFVIPNEVTALAKEHMRAIDDHSLSEGAKNNIALGWERTISQEPLLAIALAELEHPGILAMEKRADYLRTFGERRFYPQQFLTDAQLLRIPKEYGDAATEILKIYHQSQNGTKIAGRSLDEVIQSYDASSLDAGLLKIALYEEMYPGNLAVSLRLAYIHEHQDSDKN